MEEIIAPVDIEVLKSELTPDKKLRNTNKGGNELYVVTAQNSPNVMREIGRLREEAFRTAGGGTGESLDIDSFDTMDPPCKQLIVWDPDNEAIVGGYRYIFGTSVRLDASGQPIIATTHLFHFSDKFIQEYLPQTVELGRSFVSQRYQSGEMGAKGMFALDNLWDGLGAIMMLRPGMRYYFGKMTMYPSFNRYGRDLILHFLHKHFADTENLVVTRNPVKIETDPAVMDRVLCKDDFKEDYRILKKEIQALGLNIPPLVNSYMGISPSLKVFGTAVNDEFGDVEETGILVDFNDIYDEKRSRHIDSFIRECIEKMKERFPTTFENFEGEIAQKITRRREERAAKFEKQREEMAQRREKQKAERAQKLEKRRLSKKSTSNKQ